MNVPSFSFEIRTQTIPVSLTSFSKIEFRNVLVENGANVGSFNILEQDYEEFVNLSLERLKVVERNGSRKRISLTMISKLRFDFIRFVWNFTRK